MRQGGVLVMGFYSEQRYDFMVVDYKKTQHGYLFRVATVGSREREYKFIYIPFSRYRSVLMLDFYLARHASDGGYNVHLAEAVRKELGGVQGIVVISDNPGHKAQNASALAAERPEFIEAYLNEKASIAKRVKSSQENVDHMVESDLLDEIFSALRTSLKESEIGDQYFSWRVDNKPLRVFRSVALTRNILRNIEKINPKNLAFRINENELVIDLLEDGLKKKEELRLDIVRNEDGLRVIKMPSFKEFIDDYKRIFKLGGVVSKDDLVVDRVISQKALKGLFEQLLSLRDSNREADKASGRVLSVRMIDHSGAVSDVSIFSHREFNSSMEIVDTIVESVKSTQHQMLINNPFVKSVREIEERLFLHKAGYGDRDIEFVANVLRELNADRVDDAWKATFIQPPKSHMYKLKQRQYPTVLHKTGVLADRDYDRWEVYLDRVLKADRIYDFSMDYGHAIKDFVRDDVANAVLVWGRYDLYRIHDDNPTVVLEDQIHASRDMRWDLVAQKHDIKADRDVYVPLYVVKEQPKGVRLQVVKSVIDREMFTPVKAVYRPTKITNEQRHMVRVNKDHAYVLYDMYDSVRIYKEQLDVIKSYLNGTRIDKVESYIDKKFIESKRGGRKHLLVPNGDLFDADREKVYDLLVAVDYEGKRNYENDLYVPKSVEADKNQSRPATVEDILYEVVRHKEKRMYLEKALFEYRRNFKPLTIEEVWAAVRKLDRPLTYRDEDMIKFVERGAWFKHPIYPGYLEDSLLVGQLVGGPAIVTDLFIYANDQSPSHAHLLDEEFLAGVRERIQALIDCGILVGDRENGLGEVLTFNLEAFRKPCEGQEHGEYIGSRVENIGDVSVDYIADVEEKKGSIGELQDGGLSIKRAYVDRDDLNAERRSVRGDVLSDEEATRLNNKNAHMDSEDDVGGEVIFRPVILKVENPFGYIDADPSEFLVELTANKFKEGDLLSEDQLQAGGPDRRKNGLVLEPDQLGGLNGRSLDVDDESVFGGRVSNEGVVHVEDTLSDRRPKHGEKEDKSFLYQRRGINQGDLPVDNVASPNKSRYSDLPTEMPQADDTSRLADLSEEEIMASFNARIVNLITGFIFAEKEEDRFHCLEQLNAFLPERTYKLMEEYCLAKRDLKSGYREDIDGYGSKGKQAFLDRLDDTIAQGLVFDYSDDILNEGSNIEEWDTDLGYGIPNNYDPHDPFNSYYPWADTQYMFELLQREWEEFGEWEIDKNGGRIVSKSDTVNENVVILNQYSNKDFRFSVDFKVDDIGDGGAGVVFLYENEANYYYFLIHGGDSTNRLGMVRPMQLYKVEGGVPKPMGPPMQPYPWRKGEWHNIEVTVMGNRLIIKTDGHVQYDMYYRYDIV